MKLNKPIKLAQVAEIISADINGKAETEGVSEAFTRVGKVLTWSEANAGYALATTDDVVAHYNTLESA